MNRDPEATDQSAIAMGRPAGPPAGIAPAPWAGRYLGPIILFAYPVLTLVVRGATSAIFFVLVTVSLAYLVSRRMRRAPVGLDPAALAYAAAMASGCCAVLASELFHWHFGSKPFDEASRLLLAVPIFLAVRISGLNPLMALQYAFPAAALLALCIAIVHPTYDAGGRITPDFLNSIHFGDLAVMLGFLSLFSINAVGRDAMPLLLLKCVGLAAGVYLSVRSGSRGGWIAIPILGLLWTYAYHRKQFLTRSLVALALFAGLFLCLYVFSAATRQRFVEGVADLAVVSQGNLDTSIGLRFQIWKAALLLFAQNPLFGIGFDQVPSMFQALSDAGTITPLAVKYGSAEIHDEILGYALKYGIGGLAAMVSVYAVPLLVFRRTLGSADPTVRAASWMGIGLTTGFFLFGLTVEILNLKVTVTFFSLTLALLTAAATRQSRQVGGHP